MLEVTDENSKLRIRNHWLWSYLSPVVVVGVGDGVGIGEGLMAGLQGGGGGRLAAGAVVLLLLLLLLHLLLLLLVMVVVKTVAKLKFSWGNLILFKKNRHQSESFKWAILA